MSFNLPEAIVDSLLDRLGSDDGFRHQFASDPRAALAQLGFAPASDPSVQRGIWNCLTVTELAPKESIQASRSAIREQLLASRAALSPIDLQIRAALKRVA
jgi:putative modified peptide